MATKCIPRPRDPIALAKLIGDEEDVFTQNRRLWVWRREKGGKPRAMWFHPLVGHVAAYVQSGKPDGPPSKGSIASGVPWPASS